MVLHHPLNHMKTQNILLSILILLFSVSCNHSEEEVKLFNVDNINISINKSILDYYEDLKRDGHHMIYDNSHILDREGVKLYHIRGGNDSYTYIISLYFLNEKAKAIDISDSGELIIENYQGALEYIVSGEVSIMGIYGYNE